MTTSALEQQQQHVHERATAPSTATKITPPAIADLAVPGAYPGSSPGDAKPQETLEAARGYLPAQEDVQHALGQAAETAKQYLPAQVATWIPGTSNLPTKEGTDETLGRTSGAGALPGSATESGVAKLPEERALEGGAPVPTTVNTTERAMASQPPPVTTNTTILPSVADMQNTLGQARDTVAPAATSAQQTLGQATSAVTPAPGTMQSTLDQATNLAKQYLPAAVASYLPASAVAADLPSKEGTDERLGQTDGVGALPGSATEAGVAKLPDENIINASSAQHQHGTPTTSVAGEGLGLSMSADLAGKPPVVTTTNTVSHAEDNDAHPTPNNTLGSAPMPAAGLVRGHQTPENMSIRANDGSVPSSPGMAPTAAMVPLPSDSVKNVPGTTADTTSTGYTRLTSNPSFPSDSNVGTPAPYDTHTLPVVHPKDNGPKSPGSFQPYDMDTLPVPVDGGPATPDATAGLKGPQHGEGATASNTSILSGLTPDGTRIPAPVAKDEPTDKQERAEKEEHTSDYHTREPLTTGAERLSPNRRGDGELAENGTRVPSTQSHGLSSQSHTSTTPSKVPSTDSRDSEKTKVSMADKIKGEAKIISGKLSHKEDKVEEGKRMMGKI